MSIRIKNQSSFVSYDIFDTLITRACVEPRDIFLFVPRKCTQTGPLEQFIGSEEFELVRSRAEQEARKASRKEEITLPEIYSQFPLRYSSADRIALMKAEEDIELEMSVAIKKNIDHLKKIQDDGVKIVLISDMYLKKSFIFKLLRKNNVPPVDLYVSSDCNLTKHSGRLFNKIKQLHGNRNWILHVGDNTHSDGAVPKTFGISTDIQDTRTLTQEEKRILRLFKEDRALGSLIAGTAKNKRISQTGINLASPRNHFCYKIANLSALIAVNYLEWLNHHLSSEKIEKIFFLSRDGYLLYRAMKSSVQLNSAQNDVSYIHLSRSSLRLCAAMAFEEDENVIGSILRDLAPNDLSIANWLNIRHRLPNNIPESIKLWYHSAPANSFLNGLRKLPRELELQIQSFIISHARNQSDNFYRYLVSKGFFSKKRVAIVDLGWNGTIQNYLDMLASFHAKRNNLKKPIIFGYYLGILNKPSEINNYMYGWLFDFAEGRGVTFARNLQVLELLFSAPHPTTYAYKDKQGLYRPILSSSHPSSIHREMIRYASELTIQLQEKIQLYSKYIDKISSQKKLKKIISNEIIRILYNPDKEEAEYFYAVQNNLIQDIDIKKQMMHKIKPFELLKMSLGLAGLPSSNFWMSGNFALLKGPWNAIRVINLIKMWMHQLRCK